MIKDLLIWLIGSESFKSLMKPKCIICGSKLVHFQYNRSDRRETECPVGHYRIVYKNSIYDIDKDQAELNSDYSDAGHFCIRRLFQYGFSDIIRTENSYVVYNSDRIEKIFTDDEVRSLVKRYSNKNLSVML